jgi:hypothetical protein
MMQQPITGAGGTGEGRRSPSNGIALAAAAIGGFSAILSGSLGYGHAKSAYEAATGGTAGLDDYITVARAFWDTVPIAAAVALVVGLLAAGQAVTMPMLRYGAGGFGVLALTAGASLDPARHLAAYHATVMSGATDTPSLMTVWLTTYGPFAGLFGAIAGAGVGYAIGTKWAEVA